MGKTVIIIGGGIIGLSTAYYLIKEGHQVTVIDKSDMDGGASYVNAGYLTPSHIIPLASPGMMAKGIKFMFNSSSPFYMKPRFDSDFLKWAWSFNKSSSKLNVERAIPLIKEFNLISRELYFEMQRSGELGDFHLERKGLLMLYKSQKEAAHEKEVSKRALDEGLEVSYLNRAQLDTMQPNLNIEIEGAVHYECDAHSTPTQVMALLKSYLKEQNVQFKLKEEVVGFESSESQISKVTTNKRSYAADEIVIASGSWSRAIGKKLGLKILLEAGKGYRIDVSRELDIRMPAILMEAKMAVTPMNGFTRFAGTMEFSGINHKIRKERVDAIADLAPTYYNGLQILQPERDAAQCGLRPISPDGLPYIGRTSKYDNLTIATGHAMMGWSLGPATGKLVSEIIASRKTAMAISAFSPDRKF
ncbi:MAG: NAD(P)/FAD-dependent oxidoreductase [Aurantibacter sp.]